ncbi:MAG: glycosyltransferase [Dehalococcoidales bacterium]|nr:MAG: glycosyltransferase [Dehalococcoidales bacterium]
MEAYTRRDQIPSHISRSGARGVTTTTVDVVIPAFNEGNCIEGVLHDVINARQDAWFVIQNIYVISDASTDQTDGLVQRFSRGDQRIELIRKPERKGKQDSVNLAFTVSNADILIFLDADIRLADEQSIAKLVRHFRDGKAALVQGGLVRFFVDFTPSPAKQAAYFDWIVVDKIRRKKPISWWSIDGRVMALSRDFYRQLVLPLSLADDQFIFYSCIAQNRKFTLANDAIFYYGPPESIADFSHQWSRYFFYTNKSCQYFGKGFIRKDMTVPARWRTIMLSLLCHPFCGLMWVLCYGISKAEFILGFEFHRYERGFFWTKSRPLQIHITGVDGIKAFRKSKAKGVRVTKGG